MRTRTEFTNAKTAQTDILTPSQARYASAAGQHLCYAASHEQWVLDSKRFDPADNTCVASVAAAGGPVPTGAQAWLVKVGGKFVEHEVTAREVA